jgi:hypothetical protein
MNYTLQYRDYIESEKRVSKIMLRPRNIYRISSYKYEDGDTKSMSGFNSSLVFVIGIHEGKINCIKMNEIHPDKFFDWMETMFRHPVTPSEIDNMKLLEDIILITDRTGQRLFEAKVRTHPLYRTKPGPYRTYTIDGLKYIQEVTVKKEKLKELT